ncbi:S26 family signal peptidase [Spongiactinospora sp. TRM90649]|uniref:S26 family signal peptidase n=1 Tax=Spongiactinospora sp. TRM90649 TaxID=3031114 RepID=UPI0023F89958|nr:S26 family signal peptidase [Spongiactinospora sp. TRM90649]MDF5757520.1 S26 family signal peptidase [Spongiactinospora sp. TRM90649]
MIVLILIGGVVAAGAAVLSFLRSRYLVVTVSGSSMEPTYRSHDRLLARRTTPDRLRRGQVVVFSPPKPTRRGPRPGWTVKRVVAAPGDPVPRDQVPALADVPETEVPEGRLAVLGDNSAESYDSRYFGYIPADSRIALVLRPLTSAP